MMMLDNDDDFDDDDDDDDDDNGHDSYDVAATANDNKIITNIVMR